jgi:LPXTG-motif cell wall-anchored protein
MWGSEGFFLKEESMTRSRSILVVLAACLMLAVAGAASAQYSVVAVMPDGTVVLKGPAGVRSYTVPAGTTFNADGKAGVGVADLKPGMNVTGLESGIANWKATDVMVHEELNAEVVAKSGNSMLIKGSKGVEKYEWSAASDITIVKDGKVVDASAINVGDRITGMVVQKAAPGHKMAAAAPAAADTSAADAAAKKAAADKAAAEAAAAKKAAADKAAADKAAAKAARDQAAADKAAADKAAADAAAAAKPAKKLPKTASQIPAIGLAGLLALAAGASLTAVRKTRSAK